MKFKKRIFFTVFAIFLFFNLILSVFSSDNNNFINDNYTTNMYTIIFDDNGLISKNRATDYLKRSQIQVFSRSSKTSIDSIEIYKNDHLKKVDEFINFVEKRKAKNLSNNYIGVNIGEDIIKVDKSKIRDGGIIDDDKSWESKNYHVNRNNYQENNSNSYSINSHSNIIFSDFFSPTKNKKTVETKILRDIRNIFSGVIIQTNNKSLIDEIEKLGYVHKVMEDNIFKPMVSNVTRDLLNVSDIWLMNDSMNMSLNGSGVIVAVVDTGIDISHKDFGSCRGYENWTTYYGTFVNITLESDHPYPSNSLELGYINGTEVSYVLESDHPYYNNSGSILFGDGLFIPYTVNTPHPYNVSTVYVYEINLSEYGVDNFTIHFVNYSVENYYDNIYINDSNGLVDYFSGFGEDYNSTVIQGDYASIILESDIIIEGYGFEIDGVYANLSNLAIINYTYILDLNNLSAENFRVHFVNVSMVYPDVLEVYTSDSYEGDITGSYGSIWSSVINDSYIRFELVSDEKDTDYGFYIDKYVYNYSIGVQNYFFEINLSEYGAENFSIEFSNYSIETYYDNLFIYDINNISVKNLTGFSQNYSVFVNGSYAKLILDSDYIIEDYGFHIRGVNINVSSNISYCNKIADAYDFFSDDYNPEDTHGHGTHVAGTIASENEDMSLRGIAPSSRLMIYKVCSYFCSESAILSAMDSLVDPNGDGIFSDSADIMSMSIGGYGSPEDTLSLKVDEIASIGVVPVIAIGNSGSNYYTLRSPGVARESIGVGATFKDNESYSFQGGLADDIVFFSSRGPSNIGIIKPDVVAPGVNICATKIGGYSSTSYDCYDNEHMIMSGTSMATPIVSGSIALIKQMHPDWTNKEIKASLKATAIDIGYSQFVQGWGRINPIAVVGLQKPACVVEFNTSEILSYKFDMVGNYIINANITCDNIASYELKVGKIYDFDISPKRWHVLSNGTSGGYVNFNVNLSLLDGDLILRLDAYDFNSSYNNYDMLYIETLDTGSLDICLNITAEGNYSLINDINVNGSCFNILNNNINFNCNGFSIYGNGSGNAFNYEGSNNSQLSNCNIYNFSQAVLLNNSSNFNLSNNNFSDNYYDLHLLDSSNSGIFYDNNFSSMVYINTSNGPIIENVFYLNYFINNTFVNSSDWSLSLNYFNVSFDEGGIGNYWQNFTCNIYESTIYGKKCLSPFKYDINTLNTIADYYPMTNLQANFSFIGFNNSGVNIFNVLKSGIFLNISFNQKIDKVFYYTNLISQEITSYINNYSVVGSIGIEKYGLINLTLSFIDMAGNATNFTYEVYTNLSMNSLINDSDGDGINDSEDFIYGNATNIFSTYGQLDFFVNSSQNLSNNFSGVYGVELKFNNFSLVEFQHDFLHNKINLTKVRIEYYNNSYLSSMIIAGLNMSGNNKTVYFDFAKFSNNSYRSVCIKDSPIVSLSDMTNECSGSGEVYVHDFPYSNSGVSAFFYNSSEKKIVISGLSHSGIMQVCTEDWVYGSWSVCSGGSQSRTAVDNNNCGTTNVRDVLTRTCDSGGGGGSGSGDDGGSEDDDSEDDSEDTEETDNDDDGVDNDEDNCPDDSNANQSDVDSDGLGDVCDDDIDGDGDFNVVDNCIYLANANQSDIDSDGLGDVCDDDIDGDGDFNVVDNCIYDANVNQYDVDSDGLGDECDDIDNSGGGDGNSDDQEDEGNKQKDNDIDNSGNLTLEDNMDSLEKDSKSLNDNNKDGKENKLLVFEESSFLEDNFSKTSFFTFILIIFLFIIIIAGLFLFIRKKRLEQLSVNVASTQITTDNSVYFKAREYVIQYKNSFEKDAIIAGLVKAQIPQDVIDKVIAEIYESGS